MAVSQLCTNKWNRVNGRMLKFMLFILISDEEEHITRSRHVIRRVNATCVNREAPPMFGVLCRGLVNACHGAAPYSSGQESKSCHCSLGNLPGISEESSVPVFVKWD